MTTSLYADRDHLRQGEYYTRHVMAMTEEGLHKKSAIAAELAHRDAELDALRAEVERLRERCAKVVEEWATYGGSNFYDAFMKCAAEVRALPLPVSPPAQAKPL